MKQAGKRLSSFLLCMLLLTFTGCNGTEGSFYPMTNGYAVCRVSNLDVPLIYNKNWKDEVNEVWSGRTVILDYYVKGFCFNDAFVAVYGIYAKDCKTTEEELETSPVIYYLINTLTHEKYGPFNEEENLNTMCDKLKTGKFCDWIIVDPNCPLRPNT